MCALWKIKILCWNTPAIDIMAWLSEIRLPLSAIESPDITVSPVVQTDIAELALIVYAPTTNEIEPP